MVSRNNSFNGRMDFDSERNMRLKEQYNSAFNELDQLLASKRKKDAEKSEILEALEKTDRSNEEILEFLKSKPGRGPMGRL